MLSQVFSFKGYSFKQWMIRNKDVLKNLLVGVTVLTTYFSTFGYAPWLQIILTVFIPGLVKLGIDAIDFYTTEVIV